MWNFDELEYIVSTSNWQKLMKRRTLYKIITWMTLTTDLKRKKLWRKTRPVFTPRIKKFYNVIIFSSRLAFKKYYRRKELRLVPAVTLDITIRSLLQTHGDNTSAFNCIWRSHQIMSSLSRRPEAIFQQTFVVCYLCARLFSKHLIH